MENKTSMIRRLNFAALSAWLVASITMAYTALLWFGQDFRGYYAAARVVLVGGNPYDFQSIAAVLLENTGRIGNHPYYYAPWFAWFIIPFSWFPFEAARALWMIFNLTLWMISLWQLSNLLQWPKPGWGRWLTYLLATYIFAWHTWRSEQTGIILLALFVATLSALKRKMDWLAGVLLVLLLIKPNITLLPVIAISFWHIRQRNWRPLISMGMLTLVFLIVSFLVTPNWYQPFFEPGFFNGLFNEQEGPGEIIATRMNSTLYDWLDEFQVSPEITSTISVVAVIFGVTALAVIVWKSESIIQVTAAAILVNFAITPYALQYDYAPLTLVLFWAIVLAQYGERRWLAAAGATIIFFVASVPIWERPISDGYWIVVGLIGLTVLNGYSADKLKYRPFWGDSPT